MNAPSGGVGPRRRTWDSGRLTLHAAEWGDPAAPLVVIHHGFLDNARSWDAVAERLAVRWHVLAVDARGHGDSEWVGAGGAYYFPDYVLDVRNLLLSLDDPEVRLVGHSMGGGVLSYYSGAFPEQVRRLALVEGLGPPPETPANAPRVLRRFVESTRKRQAARFPRPMDSVAAAAARMLRLDPRLEEARALTLAEHSTQPVRGGVVWKHDPLHKARIGSRYNVEDAMAIWREVTAPVLVVRGAASRFVWPDYPARIAAFKDAREAVIEDAGHNVHVHAPAALAAQIDDFFSE